MRLSSTLDLFRNLVARDLKLKYQGSILGFMWSLVSPLMTLAVYSWVFLILMKTSIPHFPIFLMAGLLPWNLFAASTMSCVDALTGNAALIKKVSLPKTIFIMSIIGFNIVIFFMVLIILLAAMPVFGVPYSWNLLLLPVALVVEIVLLIGLGLLVATLNVLFHDTAHLLEVGLMAWFWLTPVVYLWTSIPTNYRIILNLNPMALVVNLYQQAILGTPIHASIGYGIAEILLILGIGILTYRRYVPFVAEWI